MAANHNIEIISDVVCPWCYIGKRRLERALEQRPDTDVTISWLPFQLNPDMLAEGVDRRAYMDEKFGSERARELIDHMSEAASGEGLSFQYEAGAKAVNTLSAHMLLYWAGELDDVDQNALAEKLFAAYHEDCEDISDPTVLARIAGQVGMDSDSIPEKLRSGSDRENIRALIEEAHSIGVSGVPFFILDRKFAISGAQPPESFLEALDQLA